MAAIQNVYQQAKPGQSGYVSPYQPPPPPPPVSKALVTSAQKAAAAKAGYGPAPTDPRAFQSWYEQNVQRMPSEGSQPVQLMRGEQLEQMSPQQFQETYARIQAGGAVVIPKGYSPAQASALAGKLGYEQAGVAAWQHSQIVAQQQAMRQPAPPAITPQAKAREQASFRTLFGFESPYAKGGYAPQQLLPQPPIMKAGKVSGYVPPTPYELRQIPERVVPGPATDESLMLKFGYIGPRAALAEQTTNVSGMGLITGFESPARTAYAGRIGREEAARVARMAPVERLGYELAPIKGGGYRTADGRFVEDIGVAIGSFAFGVVMAGPRLLEAPRFAYQAITEPTATFGGIFEGIAKRPVSGISELAGGIVGSWGISKAISPFTDPLIGKVLHRKPAAYEVTYLSRVDLERSLVTRKGVNLITGEAEGMEYFDITAGKPKYGIAQINIGELVEKGVPREYKFSLTERTLGWAPAERGGIAVSGTRFYTERMTPRTFKVITKEKPEAVRQFVPGISVRMPLDVEMGKLDWFRGRATAKTELLSLEREVIIPIKAPEQPSFLRPLKVTGKPSGKPFTFEDITGKPPAGGAAARAAELFAAGKFPSAKVSRAALEKLEKAPAIVKIEEIAPRSRVISFAPAMKEQAVFPRAGVAFPSTAISESPWAAQKKKALPAEEELYVSPQAARAVGVNVLRGIGVPRAGQLEMPAQRLVPAYAPATAFMEQLGTGQSEKFAQGLRFDTGQIERQTFGTPGPPEPTPGKGEWALPSSRMIFEGGPSRKARAVRWTYREKRHPFPSLDRLLKRELGGKKRRVRI